jgi:hypothetical protein
MKNIQQAKARAMLIVFLSYTVLSCVQEQTALKTPAYQAIRNIKERIKNKDYRWEAQFINPQQEVRKKVASAISYAQNQFSEKGLLKTANTRNYSNVFQQTSVRLVSVNENSTWGIDDPYSLSVLTDEAIAFFAGSYSANEVTSYITDWNNYLLNYSMDQFGLESMLSDQVASGAITANQKTIMEYTLQGISTSSSTTEIMGVLGIVGQELSNSNLTQEEIDALNTIHAAIEGAIDQGAIAYLDSPNARKTGAVAAIGGAALLAIGVYALVSGAMRDNTESVALGFMGGLLGMAIVVIAME